mmetsp:Transcript_20517/g.58330  ORF Transcript_20517/g.58330 Transcript_20517/m.58330 type:complete len:223 (+) Transcript_20517:668-1336(+)
MECLFPPLFLLLLASLVEDIGGDHHVNHHLAETNQFGLVSEQAFLQVAECGIHQHFPRDVDRILLRHAPGFEFLCHVWVFNTELGVGNTNVINVVDECREHDCDVRQRIRGDSVRVIVQFCRHAIQRCGFHDEIVGRNNTVQYLVGAHGHVRCMAEVVEWVVVLVGVGNTRNVVPQLFGYGCRERDIFRFQLARCRQRLVKPWQVDAAGILVARIHIVVCCC